jgi:hypothetical protein
MLQCLHRVKKNPKNLPLSGPSSQKFQPKLIMAVYIFKMVPFKKNNRIFVPMAMVTLRRWYLQV